MAAYALNRFMSPAATITLVIMRILGPWGPGKGKFVRTRQHLFGLVAPNSAASWDPGGVFGEALLRFSGSQYMVAPEP